MSQAPGCGPCDNGNPCNQVTIVQGYAKTFLVNLFWQDTGLPFDLTNVTQIIAGFPGTVAVPVVKEYLTNTNTNISIPLAKGSGQIQILVPPGDSANLQVNPYPPQLQTLQIDVTLSTGPTVYSFILANILNIVAPPQGVLT
jgi:hypothetical protein